MEGNKMIDLEAPIAEVTVYADRALITRRGNVELEAGEHELRVNNLAQFQRDSLRAAGQGPRGMRILNVDVTTAFYSRPPEGELKTLQDELDALIQHKLLLEARQSALNDRRQWLRALGEQSKDFAKGLSQGQMNPQDCADFFRFAATQALEDAEAALSLEQQLKQAQQDINAKQRELARKQGHLTPDRLAAVVTLSVEEAGRVELELSYIVMGASWYPQYDVRVQMNDEGDNGEVELTYAGVVQQFTGEAWEQVGLSLSTARPSLAAILPELEPWYLNIYTPPIIRPHMAAPMPMGAMARRGPVQHVAMSTQSSLNGDEIQPGMAAPAASLPVAAEVETATVEQTGPALVFRAGRSVDIPSDNSPHKTTIALDNLPCAFDYVSAPALEEQVHVRATIVNTTERVLLSGDASIFLGGEYVGTTRVKAVSPTETFKIFLGIEDAIKVKRELIERNVDKGNMLQSGIRRSTFGYRITVHNYAHTVRHVEIRDHLPVSRHERVKVRSVTIQPQPKERSKLEELRWQFVLAPDTEQKIEYQFTVEQPQDVTVTGLPE
jgi:uncharacterized protein (TIGR02231 family)